MPSFRPALTLPLTLSVALAVVGCGPEAEVEEPVPLVAEVPIEYPLSLWDERVEGTTVLRVWVSETGSVDSTRIMESSGHEAFDSAAVRGGRRLRFEPATRNGEPIGIWAEVPVHFTMESGGTEGDRESEPGSAGDAGDEDVASQGGGSP
ncbi:MAG: energy transducer TonB [Longimicrobiales bacterium]|nr:energy transducer TonB [Longimicrobiales bacterium]